MKRERSTQYDSILFRCTESKGRACIPFMCWVGTVHYASEIIIFPDHSFHSRRIQFHIPGFLRVLTELYQPCNECFQTCNSTLAPPAGYNYTYYFLLPSRPHV